jgi:hypothetical protein
LARGDDEIDILFVGLRRREYSSPRIFGDEAWKVFMRTSSYLAFGTSLEDCGNHRAVFRQIPRWNFLALSSRWRRKVYRVEEKKKTLEKIQKCWRKLARVERKGGENIPLERSWKCASYGLIGFLVRLSILELLGWQCPIMLKTFSRKLKEK